MLEGGKEIDMIELRLKLKPISWNVLSRKHYRAYMRVFWDWKMATNVAIRESSATKKVVSFPVDILVHARWRQKRRHDIDSLVVKPIIDQIVSSGILPDDSIKFVRSVSFTGETGAEWDEMIIKII